MILRFYRHSIPTIVMILLDYHYRYPIVIPWLSHHYPLSVKPFILPVSYPYHIVIFFLTILNTIWSKYYPIIYHVKPYQTHINPPKTTKKHLNKTHEIPMFHRVSRCFMPLFTAVPSKHLQAQLQAGQAEKALEEAEEQLKRLGYWGDYD